MAAFDLVAGGNVMGTLLGIFVGHLYYFGREIQGRSSPGLQRLFDAPRWVSRLVGQPAYVKPGETVSSAAGFTMHAPANPLRAGKPEAAARFRPFTGTAKKLGSD